METIISVLKEGCYPIQTEEGQALLRVVVDTAEQPIYGCQHVNDWRNPFHIEKKFYAPTDFVTLIQF